MTKLIHDAVLEWPNGEGFTPCTHEYADKMFERDMIFNVQYDSGSTEDLSPEDYNRWHTLNDELMGMLENGHIGKSVRY